MKEPCVEGVATHDGPESCAVAREGGGEALTGVRAGRVLSRENTYPWVPTPWTEAGGNTGGTATREVLQDPPRSKTPCAYGSTLRGNREIPSSPTADGAVGRVGKFKDAIRR
jgi:hypothetical protein